MLSLYVGASVVQSPPVGSNLCDGQGHVVLFEQAFNTFYVTVDTVHAAAITDVIVPLLTMKVYFEGFPSTRADMALQPLTACVLSPPEWYLAPDGFDAVSVQNVAPPTSLCLGTCQLTVMASSSTSVLQSRPQALHSSWNMVLGVISAAASLPRYIVYTSIT
ncbi:hypothetical protein EMCRGX_G027751 [Ephydatia muelleri]